MVVEGSRAIAQVARELGLSETSLGNWVRAYREAHAIDEPPLEGIQPGHGGETVTVSAFSGPRLPACSSRAPSAGERHMDAPEQLGQLPHRSSEANGTCRRWRGAALMSDGAGDAT